MKDLINRLAVVSGGGAGMGRELVLQLLAEGCHVATCDISAAAMAETKRLAEASKRPQGTRLTTHTADVADEAQVLRWRDEIAAQHATDKIHLLFNNAGIGGGGSFITGDRADWEKTFNICWNGVYLCTRAFMPMLVKADAGHIVNTSSVNGFWASIGPGMPHSAYCAAKFAVKGFTESLITDLRLTAPHIKCSVVMPGHIGTSIAANSRRLHGSGPLDSGDTDTLTPAQLAQARFRLTSVRPDAAQLSDADILKLTRERERKFLEEAPTTAAQAATIILDGVKAERWRILVGRDAEEIDARVRATPEDAYEAGFFNDFAREVGWRLNGEPKAR